LPRYDGDMNVADRATDALGNRIRDIDQRCIVLPDARIVMPNRADVQAELNLRGDSVGKPRDRLRHLLQRPMEYGVHRLIEIVWSPQVFFVLRLHGNIELDGEVIARHCLNDLFDLSFPKIPSGPDSHRRIDSSHP
jgi:hypothetical protein